LVEIFKQFEGFRGVTLLDADPLAKDFCFDNSFFDSREVKCNSNLLKLSTEFNSISQRMEKGLQKDFPVCSIDEAEVQGRHLVEEMRFLGHGRVYDSDNWLPENALVIQTQVDLNSLVFDFKQELLDKVMHFLDNLMISQESLLHPQLQLATLCAEDAFDRPSEGL
jgi:hypothetical protein